MVDLLDTAAVCSVVQEVRPDVVLHLAAISQVRGHSGAAIRALNVDASVQLADALWQAVPEARLVALSTGYVHGETRVPADEQAALEPVGPYAESKAELERALRAASGGRDLCLVRPFNHTGPGQPTGFAVPAFLESIRAVCEGRADAIRVGDLTATRDLADVRDLADGLAGLCRWTQVPPVLQICSGRGRTMGEVLDLLRQQVGGRAQAVPVQASGRSDLRRCVGNPALAHRLGIRSRPLSDTLADMVAEAGISRGSAAHRP
jgi:GDP-4-dehydro-6-deoxy-D-mannose reductase